MDLFNFNTAYSHIRELYGIELNPDEFETIGLIAWEKIGNKLYSLTTATLPIVNSLVNLPCETNIIEAVYITSPDFQSTSNQENVPLIHNEYVEKYIDLRRGENNSPLYKNGKLIKYRIVNPTTIEVGLPEGYVNVLYKTVAYDEAGLPLINSKEIDAIAAYCAYTDSFKKSLQTRDQSTFQMAQVLEQRWLKLCDHARTPMSMSQNDFDKLGDVKYSWDRKSYGKSYKPVR